MPERDRGCPITGAPAPSSNDGYDWEADALGCWRLCVDEARRRKLAGEPPFNFFEPIEAEK